MFLEIQSTKLRLYKTISTLVLSKIDSVDYWEEIAVPEKYRKALEKWTINYTRRTINCAIDRTI